MVWVEFIKWPVQPGQLSTKIGGKPRQFTNASISTSFTWSVRSHSFSRFRLLPVGSARSLHTTPTPPRSSSAHSATKQYQLVGISNKERVPASLATSTTYRHNGFAPDWQHAQSGPAHLLDLRMELSQCDDHQLIRERKITFSQTEANFNQRGELGSSFLGGGIINQQIPHHNQARQRTQRTQLDEFS